MRRKWVHALAALLALLLAVGCGQGVGKGRDGDSDSDVDTPTECVSAADADISGWWALKVFVRLEIREDPSATVHVCEDPPFALAYVTWILHFDEETETGVPYTFRTCAIELPQVTASFADCSLGETFVAYLLTSESLDDSLPLVEHSGTALLSGTSCAEVETRDLFVRIGISDDFDNTSPLPGWDADCTGTTALECVPGYETDVEDTDTDGFPGATFEIETDPAGLIEGVAWATLRHMPYLSGTMENNAMVRGSLEPALEYDLVGSEATMAGLDIDTPTVKRNLPDFLPVGEGSSFTMVRVDSRFGSIDLSAGDGDVSCTEVLASAGLFD